MDIKWKDLTTYQKSCQVLLPPDTRLKDIVELVEGLHSPWKEGCTFSWRVEGYSLKIHAQRHPK